ncbi:DUF951 domain-containing protein [Bombilactobacillus thymidiniphilus]|uniref:DUF951 domain-containing protein n=1 Tax=Bombilactobacillus thymidiniphilus TaxID=2923363 RepID=A0ABY4PB85_9LACO|nr:DUF951 domain-containing protein [Bombilactobacillus thymidiniphilus]UQS83023.1 DUF951 domain-containing protein [Bombilactobacillus thymidiniphilus]
MYNLGDIIMMKKPHACQNNRWEVLRLGADIKIRCLGCGHQIMMARAEFNKKYKKIITQQNEVHRDQETFYIDPRNIKSPNQLQQGVNLWH